MNEIIQARDGSYKRYEELLLRKNDLKKECLQLEAEYTRVFGEQLIAVFKLKLACARKKKTIEFCRKAFNRGEMPDEEALKLFVEKETLALRDHLEQMKTEYEGANDYSVVTEVELTKIRTIYRKIAKRIHPDINPAAKGSEKLQTLWVDVVSAYNRNDLKELRELEVLVTQALAEVTGEEAAVQIPDPEKKIPALEEEIRHIMDTDPYQYKFLLLDREAVQEKKDELDEENKAYREYSEQLDAALTEVLPEGVFIIWDSI